MPLQLLSLKSCQLYFLYSALSLNFIVIYHRTTIILHSQVIQIDEAALREGLPLRKAEQAHYLEWAVHGFRITNCGVKDTTQVCLNL
jgi:hypothetical protein